MADADGAQVQLYDLLADPGEENNLADQHPGLAERLLKKLLEWRNSLP